jgi:hypothetical protein
MTGQNVWNKSLSEHFFQGFEPLFRSLDLDPQQGEKSDPDPHKIKISIRIRIQIRIRVTSRILTRINVMRIHKTVQKVKRQKKLNFF